MPLTDAASIARRHEELLFRRAYPCCEQDALAADGELLRIGCDVQSWRDAGKDLTSLEEPEISGIAGTGITAVYGYGVARHLLRTHDNAVRIAWEAYDEPERLGLLLPHLVPQSDEDALVEANVPYDEWIRAASGEGSDLAWLVDALEKRFPNERERAERFDALQIPLRWELAKSSASRTLMRLPVRALYCHNGPLIARRDVSLDEIPGLPPLPVRRVSRKSGEALLALARDTSAVRYRELHGFTWGDPAHVDEIDAGRGVRFYLSGVPPQWRLPLRAYHAMSIWKNGVPIGYFEALSLFERMDAGFNLYYTFRDGETAWLYARILQAMHQLLGITCFVVDPYQIGDGNEEGLASGAFWFYRKLGFRSTDPGIRRMTEREERRLARHPGALTPERTLRKLVKEPLLFQFPGTETGDWDAFRLRTLGLNLARGGSALRLPSSLRAAKAGPEECGYLKLMRKDQRFRARVLAAGSL